VRTVLFTFLALFLALALLLALTAWAIPTFPRYAGFLALLALPVVLVLGLALGVRLYLRYAPFSDAAPTATGERVQRGSPLPQRVPFLAAPWGAADEPGPDRGPAVRLPQARQPGVSPACHRRTHHGRIAPPLTREPGRFRGSRTGTGPCARPS
jgi:hypothetical protein